MRGDSDLRDVRDLIEMSRSWDVSQTVNEDDRMNSRISRPLAVAAIVLSAGAIGAGTATAAAPAPVSGSVEVCVPLPLPVLEVSLCL